MPLEPSDPADNRTRSVERRLSSQAPAFLPAYEQQVGESVCRSAHVRYVDREMFFPRVSGALTGDESMERLSLAEFSRRPECPYTAYQLGVVAWLAIRDDPEYRHLPFTQLISYGQYWVYPELFKIAVERHGAPPSASKPFRNRKKAK